MRYALTILVCLCTVVAAEKKVKKVDPLKATIAEVNAAVSKGDAVALAASIERAKKIRENYKDKKLAPLVSAIGKGCSNKKPGVAQACIEGLGALKVAGSSKALSKLLNPGVKVSETKLPLHVAAIEAAGNIHDAGSQKTLEKLLGHSNTEISVAAGRAMAGYRWLDEKPRLTLARRLVKTLGALEAKVKSAKNDDKRDHLSKTAASLNTGISKLLNQEGILNAADWTEWLKKQSRKKA